MDQPEMAGGHVSHYTCKCWTNKVQSPGYDPREVFSPRGVDGSTILDAQE